MTRADGSHSVPSSLPRLLRGRTLKTAPGMMQGTISHRPGVWSRCAAQPLAAGLALGLTLLAPNASHAGIGDDPTLVLGVSRDGRIDQQLTKAVTDRMLHNGENVLTNNRLLSSERQCLSGECFDNIASREHAQLLFTSQLQQNAPGSFYITAVLYDAVKHIPFQEGSPCECSSEELASKVSDLADKLLKRYRERPLVPSASGPSTPQPPLASVGTQTPSSSANPGSGAKETFTKGSKIAAGVVGGLGLAALVTSIAWTASNGSDAPGPCGTTQPQVCYYDYTTHMKAGYAVTGILAVGVGVALIWGNYSARKHQSNPPPKPVQITTPVGGL